MVPPPVLPATRRYISVPAPYLAHVAIYPSPGVPAPEGESGKTYCDKGARGQYLLLQRRKPATSKPLHTKGHALLFPVEAIFHAAVSGTRGDTLKIQTIAIRLFVGFVSRFSGIDLSSIKLHWGHLPKPNTEYRHLCPQL